MTTIDFNDAIAELLHQIYSANPKDEDFATTRSQNAIDAKSRSSLRLVPGWYETFALNNASK